MCSPLDTQVFKDFFESTPETFCRHCLPSCSYTIYSSFASSAPFAPCTPANIGTSKFCQITHKPKFAPMIWQESVKEIFGDEIPQYLSAEPGTNLRE